MMTSRKMVSLQLPETLYNRLNDEARAFGISRSDVIRMALTDYIDRQQDIMRQFRDHEREAQTYGNPQ